MTDSTSSRLQANAVDEVKKELDKVDRSHPMMDNICTEILEALDQPVSEIVIFLLDRITPDVLINPASMEKKQIFHALRKLREIAGNTVGYAPGIPIPNKVSTAL